MDILVVLENNGGSIHRMSLEAIVAAQKLADEQSLSNAILAIGSDTSALANAAANYNIGEVLTVEHNLRLGAAVRNRSEIEKQLEVVFNYFPRLKLVKLQMIIVMGKLLLVEKKI